MKQVQEAMFKTNSWTPHSNYNMKDVIADVVSIAVRNRFIMVVCGIIGVGLWQISTIRQTAQRNLTPNKRIQLTLPTTTNTVTEAANLIVTIKQTTQKQSSPAARIRQTPKQ
eukprot:300153_1